MIRIPVTCSDTWALETRVEPAHPRLGTRSFDVSRTLALCSLGVWAADLTVEWTPHGVVPLSIDRPDRTIDIGPRAESSFVSAA